jgi:hypothetical protein
VNIRTRRWYHALLVGRFFTPRGFVVSAAQVSALFLIMHLAGLRSCTTIFIGAVPAAGLAGRVAAGLGLAYIVFYLAFTVAVPILLVAAGLLRLAGQLGARRLRGAARTTRSSSPTSSP